MNRWGATEKIRLIRPVYTFLCMQNQKVFPEILPQYWHCLHLLDEGVYRINIQRNEVVVLYLASYLLLLSLTSLNCLHTSTADTFASHY